ncbi:3-keto-5-aminohexanoate cleavage protein [Nocardiopsis ansamitocini]|uniref:3-keto-5-aminohexanoate cleavage protein n=1 Tax=Nocardiopsis ansamitocini TaxID=1670832 RepID=A0A9W6P587_9ACTN|nr:3-keto-5-aminohexanoate cleavage protein [Nocardiopsis ansamitocini]GLU47445.1 hypothetical protein Nans01_17960 [Nocardiopsis ansamitocini]
MRIVACLNGDRRPGEHPALPISPDQLAADAAAVVGAGATAVHVHPRDGRGRESLDHQLVTALLDRLHDRVPGVPVSVTTSLSAEPDAWRRLDLVGRWGTLPDSATVNMHEPGSLEVARVLAGHRVAVEAGVWTVEAARVLVASHVIEVCSSVLIEPVEQGTDEALRTLSGIASVLDRARSTVPRMLHGRDATAWPLLDKAVALDLDVRMGLEDCLLTPDGAEATDNTALVGEAAARVRAER